MGRMLLGVDLDESPVGGLVERLLSEEELEKLADGGQPAGTDDPSDEAGDDGSNAPADDSEAAPGESAEDPLADLLDESGSPEDDVGGRDTGGHGADGATDSRGIRERVAAAGPGGEGGRLAGYRPLLLKAAVVLALLAVLAVLAWRYAGRVTGVVPDRVTDRVGSSGEESAADDVSPARRRAKVSGDEASERPGRSDEDTEWTTKAPSWRRSRDDADEADESDDAGTDGVRSVGAGLDLGALVGLATLALIAALVRKFGEDRPRDPLVDGPEE